MFAVQLSFSLEQSVWHFKVLQFNGVL